ncbi:fructosamine kinase family protein [Marinobacter oulmenensis]|uniref:Fructosamine-3-kinase n=1 Tax=Marinobacter oulmenensis TaxID=643747 RepID=A0A840UBU8_9GAMM|nr:fructosamine kinase family protein [Marinobacter oulmenensis]MBB5320730.1 fructosamine-3-kinase [Marinobacter oulmenensis]
MTGSFMDTFSKTNESGFADALTCEARGLDLLREAVQASGTAGVAIPEVLSVDEKTLVIPRIFGRPATADLMAGLGEGLAGIHQQQATRYGLDHDNYIGLARQKNTWSDDWGQFFLDYRLGYQVGLIRNSQVRAEFEQVLSRNAVALVAFLNRHCDRPSLIHGDLWSGNALFDRERAWLIDPAVYYGDREADLAMTEFFGGFEPAFYQAYDRVWPRTMAYPAKRSIYNLYHALNHYNLFGSGYLGACRQLLLDFETCLTSSER